jgi:hypothetical protein
LSLYADRLQRAVKSPGPANLALAAALVVAVGGALWWLRRRVARATRGDRPPRREAAR